MFLFGIHFRLGNEPKHKHYAHIHRALTLTHRGGERTYGAALHREYRAVSRERAYVISNAECGNEADPCALNATKWTEFIVLMARNC